MNSQVIITKEPGQIIPRGYLQVALKQFPSCIGITIQDVVEKEPVLDVSVENRTMSVDDLMKVVESCKDVRMVVVLGKMEQDFNPETDVQPYVFQQAVEGEDPQNIITFHCEGDFPNYAKPGKGHTDEYNYWEDFIYPTLLEKFEASSDLNQFFSRINSSAMKQAVENPIAHRGVIVFVPLEGDIIAYGRNDLGGKFEWGTTSQTLGWGTATKIETAAETAIAAVKKTGGRLAKLMGTAAPAPGVTPATSVPQTEKPVIKTDDKGIHHTGGNDPFAAWPGTSSKTHTMMRPPTGLQGNARNRWIRLFLNLSPQAELPKSKDHSNFMIPVPLALVGHAQEEVTTNDGVKVLADKVKQFHGPAGDPVSQQMASAHEEKNPKKPAAQPEGDNRPTADFLPECPPEEAKASAELVTEWATNPKQPTSLEVQRIESKWPLFTVSRGIKLENVARWSIAEKKLFTKKCPNDAARLISELVLKLHEYGAFDKQVNTEHQNDKQDKSNNNTPAGPGPSQTEKTPAASGNKKSRLARLTGSAA